MISTFTTGDPDGNGGADTYGTSFERLDAVSQRFIHSMFRVGAEGNGWIVNDDGSFTHAIETDEFRAALEYAREVWASGACHPDSLTQTSNEVREQLMAGTAGSGPNAFILLNFIRSEAAKVNPNAQIIGLAPPGHDGGEGVAYNIGGWFGQFCIPTPNQPGRSADQRAARRSPTTSAPRSAARNTTSSSTGSKVSTTRSTTTVRGR